MRFFVIATRSQTASPDVFTPELLNSEGKRALKLLADDFIREIYNRTDSKGGVIVVEAASESEVKEKLGTLPMVQAGLLSLEIYGTKLWRVFEAMAKE